MPKVEALPVGEQGLMEVVAQRANVLEAQLEVKVQTYRFAELLSAQDGTDHVTVASAARACGISKGYATTLVHRWREGDLDPPTVDVETEVAELRKEAARLLRRINA